MNVDNILNSNFTMDYKTELIDLISNDDANKVTTKSPIHISKIEHSFSDDTNMSITSSYSFKSKRICLNDDVSVVEPVFKVKFRDENVSRQYRKQIKDFLYNLLKLESSDDTNFDTSDLTLEIWDNKNDIEDIHQIHNECNILSNDTNDNEESNLLFKIDNIPTKNNDNLDIPIYGQKYKNMINQLEAEAEADSKDAVQKLNCFNCNGNHNMRDCQLPRNQANINKNRKEFIAKYNTGIRYHMSDQRFNHLVPGQLSSKLRQALGLRDNEMPRHIYRMRLFGYPPGWLEEARLQYSGLSLFNSDGVAEADPNDEEGEIIGDEDRDQYDLKKIHEFPGFNVLPPFDTIDESYKHRVPQMQSIHSKEMMLLQLGSKKTENGYKRKKLKLSTSMNSSNVLNFSSTSMNSSNVSNFSSNMCETEDIKVKDDIVENVSSDDIYFVPPLPKESVSMPPVPPSSESSELIIEDSGFQSREFLPLVDDMNLQSLSDLEDTKKELLIKLEDINSNFNSTTLKNDLSIASTSNASFSDVTPQSIYSSTLQRSPNQDSTKSDLQSSDQLSDLDSIVTSDTSFLDTSLTFSPNFTLASSDINPRIKSVCTLGTPILQSSSPYNKLPSSEKFSKNICDVLHFENLPDATGKYKQISNVLQKVRSTMQKLHQPQT